ncbi:hypothetical protein diail_1098 [Diaporthe ilicicola]|nr:hypothetical protein diail_1098 [Diaporthe ilicicola]
MTSHHDPGVIYNSATDMSCPVDEVLQGLDAVGKRLDALSAEMKFLKETTTKTQTEVSAQIFNFALGQNPGHNGTNCKNCKLFEGYQRMLQEREGLLSRVKTLEDDLVERDQKLLEQQSEIRRQLKQINKLRGIVLDKAGDQKVCDDEVVQAFSRVRQETLALAKSAALRVDQIPALKPDARPSVHAFYGDGEWESWKPKDRELRLRKSLFHMLHRLVFDQACFGIEGFQASSFERPGPIAAGLSSLETEANKQRGELVDNEA